MADLERYLRTGHKHVQGWLAPFSARYIAELGLLQKEAGIKGPSAEIGVHHGRLFILLHLISSGDRDLAIDIFGDQHLNVGRSGRGDLGRFLSNLRRWGGALDRVDVLQKSSLLVTAEEVRKRVGPVCLFSVDGGHTAECALNDLKLAEAALHPDGVVILDDFFNEVWPEVCVGAVQYLLNPESQLRPFAVTPNKLYLCKPARNAFYREKMQERFDPRKHDKNVEMFGSPVSVMGTVRHGAVQRFRHSIADSQAGPFLKAMLGRRA